MKRYNKLFYELTKVEEFSQRAIDFTDDLSKDESYKMESLKLYRLVEKKLKNFIEKYYSNSDDIDNFSKAIISLCMKEIVSDTHKYSTITLAVLMAAASSITSAKLKSDSEKDDNKDNKENEGKE
jgi:hypothetical protein